MAEGLGQPSMQVSTVGEALVVLSPEQTGPLDLIPNLVKGVGGAEVNVAIGLARLGHSARWMGRVGKDPFGRQVERTLVAERVDACVISDPSRPTGVCFEQLSATGQHNAYYYRGRSAASALSASEIACHSDWLLDTQIVHLTGITPALSATCRAAVLELMREAGARGVPVSFDATTCVELLGDTSAVELLYPLMRDSRIVFVSRTAAQKLFGADDVAALEQARESLNIGILVTHDASGAWAVHHDGVDSAAAHRITVIDPAGARDAFVTGYLAGWLRSDSAVECLQMATLCAASVMTTRGNYLQCVGSPGRHSLDLAGWAQ
ncbi:sugar kinase [Mycobacteroides abscessus]|uniref:sugar kinase n=1 Tax=Mycobacteroides abscessus TaxID=36809 RepID=UPI000C269C2C